MIAAAPADVSLLNWLIGADDRRIVLNPCQLRAVQSLSDMCWTPDPGHNGPKTVNAFPRVTSFGGVQILTDDSMPHEEIHFYRGDVLAAKLTNLYCPPHGDER